MKKIIDFLKIIGILLIILTITLTVIQGFSIKNSICLIVGIVLYIVCKVYFRLSPIFKKIIVITIILGFLGFSFLLSLILSEYNNTPDFNEEVVIVLGCGLKGDEPNSMLEKRLDKTIEYLNKNPNAMVIVSGGQGSDEPISESEAMRRYLVKNGIDISKIIKEDQSDNTYENIKFTKEVMKENNLKPEKIVIISSKFHLYRAKDIAKRDGINSKFYGSNIVWYDLPTTFIREMISIMKHYYIVLKEYSDFF